MNNKKLDFFKITQSLRNKVRNNVEACFCKIPDHRIKQILLQRQKTSSFLKGISSYYIHKGLQGRLSEIDLIEVSSSIEIYSTGLVILDNIIDNHGLRNGRTTYLKELGYKVNMLASYWATHLGIYKLLPHTTNFLKIIEDFDFDIVEDAIIGMISMDIDHPKSSATALDTISKVNGITFGVPLAITASTATTNPLSIYDIYKYGLETGTAFGLYEELLDLMGQHGRHKASEISCGRKPYCLLICEETNSWFNADDYMGKHLTEESHRKLINELRIGGALDSTVRIIEKNLESGRKRIAQQLEENNYRLLDILRITIENTLQSLIYN